MIKGIPEIAQRLDLSPHPEGGWFKRTWTAQNSVEAHGGVRPAATLIHYLLTPGEFSAWHKVASDEIWLWHGPGTLELVLGGSDAHPAQNTQTIVLGGKPAFGQQAQALVSAGFWQKTNVVYEEVLLSCLVSPGFSFEDWQLEST